MKEQPAVHNPLAVQLSGGALIDAPLLNKGTAFTQSERVDFGLLGLLPPHIESLAEQVARAYDAFCAESSDLDKHIFLRQLQDENETLFYRLLLEHTAEMMPIIYTPVVGEACQQFSEIYRRPRGVFIAYPERDSLDQILENVKRDIDVIVVTDGQRILGLGDQGAGGMGIPIGKLSLYSLCGGIHPARTLPIVLDVGTNNQDRLADPRYIGWRHERIEGDAYFDFIEQFVAAVMRRFPHVLLQWEDFASVNAEPILERYRDRLCTFNDDIQGTAAVTTGTILAAVAAAGGSLEDQRFVMLGAGSAGVGISEQLIRTMIRDGISEADARGRFYVLDRGGLIHKGRSDLDEVHRPIAQDVAQLRDWDCDVASPVTFADVVRNVRPTVLVGATGQPGVFTQDIVREMAKHAERPIIFPLSNPTSRAEATPADLLQWTDGRAIVATGSPFDPVQYNNVTHTIAQCNNSYIFPAMGTAILATNTRRVTDEMFMAAAIALKECSPATKDPHAPLLPSLADIRQVSRHIALAVAREAQQQGVAQSTSPEQLEQLIDDTMWMPQYSPYTQTTA
jgi:malate dehydrogenase (oxaloacetate-decarboxylating)